MTQILYQKREEIVVELQSSNMPFCSNPCPREGVPHKDMPGVWPWHWKTSTHKPKKCFKSFLKEMVILTSKSPQKSWFPTNISGESFPPKKNKGSPKKLCTFSKPHTPPPQTYTPEN